MIRLAVLALALALLGCAAYQEVHLDYTRLPDGSAVNVHCAVYQVFPIGTVSGGAYLPGGTTSDSQRADGITITRANVCVDGQGGRQSDTSASTTQSVLSALIGAVAGYFTGGAVH